MEPILDLFGMPIPEGKGKRGRPQHFVTEENRNKVSMLLAFGWTNERIANALGISQPTLRKFYFHELKRRLIARDMLDARRFELLWKLAAEGNVASIREFNRLLEKSDAVAAERSFRGDDDDESDIQMSKLGKKEAAALAAEAAEHSDSWGSDLAFRGRMN